MACYDILFHFSSNFFFSIQHLYACFPGRWDTDHGTNLLEHRLSSAVYYENNFDEFEILTHYMDAF